MSKKNTKLENEVRKMKNDFKRMIDEMPSEEFLDMLFYIIESAKDSLDDEFEDYEDEDYYDDEDYAYILEELEEELEKEENMKKNKVNRKNFKVLKNTSDDEEILF